MPFCASVNPELAGDLVLAGLPAAGASVLYVCVGMWGGEGDGSKGVFEKLL